jgi:hypothetical protein
LLFAISLYLVFIFLISVSVLRCRLLRLPVTDGNMASGGLRATSLSPVTKLNAGYIDLIAELPAICYIACYGLVFLVN